ncbi:MAG: hypothetical protein ACOH2R_09200, partial [Pseudomonas sp.]
ACGRSRWMRPLPVLGYLLMLTGLNPLTLATTNLPRSVEFYVGLLVCLRSDAAIRQAWLPQEPLCDVDRVQATKPLKRFPRLEFAVDNVQPIAGKPCCYGVCDATA